MLWESSAIIDAGMPTCTYHHIYQWTQVTLWCTSIFAEDLYSSTIVWAINMYSYQSARPRYFRPSVKIRIYQAQKKKKNLKTVPSPKWCRLQNRRFTHPLPAKWTTFFLFLPRRFCNNFPDDTSRQVHLVDYLPQPSLSMIEHEAASIGFHPVCYKFFCRRSSIACHPPPKWPPPPISNDIHKSKLGTITSGL